MKWIKFSSNKWDKVAGIKTYPKEDQKCLILLENGEIWHTVFDSYTDSIESPPYDFRTIATFGPFGRLRFKQNVVAWIPVEELMLV